jgi:hypothetical protein
MFTILIAGFTGGVIRGLIGFVKHHYSYKNVKFDLKYFIVMVFISGAIGFLTTISIQEVALNFEFHAFSPALAIISGYAGGDILENVYKILFKKLVKDK